jgi:Ca2+-binding RTX toxin-like protein
MFIWLRVGDGGDYVSFDSIDEAVDYLNELQVGKVDGWTHGGSGFTTANYWGHDYISCYWGDEGAQLVSGILPQERAEFDVLKESYL